ncbi:phosphoribosyltransferase [Candidatus Nitrosocosmicus agrestis]|jgi:predicted phosphoribosyltransferase|uniref:phosphoribosyltransferase n=1 Tax=Candidatus Nitrosocosmicus agrestis TaxID=2563600 RepID=UPI00122E11D3|nr:phosphoribosyltransferase family protein [Candidatus Nitrosocosmicus sp. SS]KAA2282785.1 phosphoribosyltransferase [Candidatus Nitrosocosmicus sp. SS]KAF0870281.1 phosphoribosyltransferase [Candidatus Nitrosocosmicus sp. SS]
MLFNDRIQAGEELANAVEKYLLGTMENFDNLEIDSPDEKIIVLAIPRGGIILGDVIASRLRCNLDMVISKKIGAPNNKELAIGAVMPGGTYFVKELFIKLLDISNKYIQEEVKVQTAEIERRLQEFRGNRTYSKELAGKVVILTDDGIATGATILAAAQWIVKDIHNYEKFIVAVPVAPRTSEIIEKLKQMANKVIILNTPIEFSAVGQFYRNFEQVSDEEVKAIMKKYAT